MTKLTLACGLALSLGLMACASNPDNAAPAAPAGSSPAPAATTGAAPEATTAGTKPKLVCEESKPLGSLLPQRICMTPEEAAKRKREAQERVRDIQNQSAVGPGMGSSSGG